MQSMTPGQKAERNKANYLKAKAAFNKNEMETCMSYYGVDHQIRSKQIEKGRDGIRQYLENLHQMWPDIQINVEHLVAEDNWVMGRSVANATHTNSLFGLPPTNKKITTTFWDLHLFNEDGLIIETWNLTDNLEIMKQIGLLPDKP